MNFGISTKPIFSLQPARLVLFPYICRIYSILLSRKYKAGGPLSAAQGVPDSTRVFRMTFRSSHTPERGDECSPGLGTPVARPEPKVGYDAVIVGGGGHGLATAYYLAKEHGMRNIAVFEKGWIGGGNTGRNTTIIRSNYLYDESAAIYEHALKLWEACPKTT